jgi:hypothetical protein
MAVAFPPDGEFSVPVTVIHGLFRTPLAEKLTQRFAG